MATRRPVEHRAVRNRADRVRRRLAVGAVVATLPYSALKVGWLAGSRVGLQDASFGTSATMHVLNAATFGLDLVALGLAIAFFRGTRAPTWFVLPTMWIGYGLLGQIVMIIGPSIVVQLITGPPTTNDGAAPIAGWVYAVVYTGFSGLGLCLLPAFGIYAWQRWAGVNGWGERLSGIPRTLPRWPTAAVAVVSVALLVRSVCSSSAPEAMGWCVDAVIGFVAVLTVRSARRGRPTRMRRAVPLAVLWTASGAWTAWAAYGLVLGVVPNDLADETASPVDVVLLVAKLVAGAGLLFTVRRLASSSGRDVS